MFILSKSYPHRNWWHHISLFVRFFRVERPVDFIIGENLGEVVKKYPAVKREVQAALLEYLHSTRNLRFEDAEYMTNNTPEFFDRLLQRVEIDDGGDASHSLTRFLRYHPVNEFEPFFESIGLNSSEYASFLPRNSMFLDHDQFLLQIYYALCDYGFSRNAIGKIFKEARVIFRHDSAMLQSKLKFFEGLGLKQFLVVKIIASSPYLLTGDSNKEFIQFLAELKKIGIEYDWLDQHIHEDDSPNWRLMLNLIHLLHKLDFNEENLKQVITRHPHLLHKGSGHIPFRVLTFLLKFGLTKRDIQSIFLQFPDIPVSKFFNNLHRCYKFFALIKMPVEDIGSLFRTHPQLLGSCQLREFHTIRRLLNRGRPAMRQLIEEDPHVLKKWSMGVRVETPPRQKNGPEVKLMRSKFLLSLGFVEKSKEMEKAVRKIWGKAPVLKERFDCLVNAGLSREDVVGMLKAYPDIMNQSKDNLEAKIGSFVGNLGYNVSDLIGYPRLLTYTVERTRFRLSMYKWLKDEGAVKPNLGLGYLLSCPEEEFVRRFVSCHARGLETWDRLKEEYRD